MLVWLATPTIRPRYLTGGHKLSGNSQLHIEKSLKTEDFSNIQGSVTKSVTVTFLFRLEGLKLNDTDWINDFIDFSSISLTEVISKAIADAELLMEQGKYDSAFDRIHTAFHGYLRKVLDNKQVGYEESDTLSQLYTKLHTEVSANIGSTEIAELVKKSLRSASGVIAAINEMRNRHSLSHPNDDLLQKREAEFAIKLVKDMSDYINSII